MSQIQRQQASGSTSHLWEDKETQDFYESMTDLRVHVPAIVYKVKDAPPLDAEDDQADQTALDEAEAALENDPEGDGGGEGNGDEVNGDGDSNVDGGPNSDVGDEDMATPLPDEREDDSWGDGLTATDPMMVLCEKLPTCVNRNTIDEAAVEFASNLNNKCNREVLSLALFKVRRSRLDLLPLFARLVATIHPGIPEVAEELAGHLQGEFRFFRRKRLQDNLESQIKNVRFLAELTKFRMVKPAVVLMCLQVLLRTFKGVDIDLICSILETCGRFLYRTGTTHVRVKRLLEILKKKREAFNLDTRHNSMIDNAFYNCNPPEHTQVQRKVRPIIHEFFRHMVYDETSGKASTEAGLKAMRKFPWNDEEFYAYAVKCFVRSWKVKFDKVTYLARLLYKINVANQPDARDSLHIMVVDAVVEEIRVGMEVNNHTHNQRRLCTVKYLAELYRYKLVDSKVIFTTLFSLISSVSFMDPPDNYFRCKLVCTLLDTCGPYFILGGTFSKGRLQDFLVYFQRYAFFTKQQPLPSDTDITISDTIEILALKGLQLFETVEEADAAIHDIEVHQRQKLVSAHQLAGGSNGGIEKKPGDDDDGERQTDSEDDDGGSDSDSDDDEDDEMNGLKDAEEDAEENAEEDTDGDVRFRGDEDEEEEIESDADDDAFVKEFEKMMANEIEARRNDTATTSSIQKLDVAIPMHLKGSKPLLQVDDGDSAGEEKVVFTLLNRKGATQKATQLVVPIASGLADRMMARQEAEALERRRNAKFVIGYEEREQEKELEAEELAYQQSAFGGGGGGGGYGGRGRRPGIRLFSSSSGRGRGRSRGGLNPAREKRKKDQEFLREMGYSKTSKPPSQNHAAYRGGPIPSSATENGDW